MKSQPGFALLYKTYEETISNVRHTSQCFDWATGTGPCSMRFCKLTGGKLSIKMTSLKKKKRKLTLRGLNNMFHHKLHTLFKRMNNGKKNFKTFFVKTKINTNSSNPRLSTEIKQTIYSSFLKSILFRLHES